MQKPMIWHQDLVQLLRGIRAFQMMIYLPLHVMRPWMNLESRRRTLKIQRGCRNENVFFLPPSIVNHYHRFGQTTEFFVMRFPCHPWDHFWWFNHVTYRVHLWNSSSIPNCKWKLAAKRWPMKKGCSWACQTALMCAPRVYLVVQPVASHSRGWESWGCQSNYIFAGIAGIAL